MKLTETTSSTSQTLKISYHFGQDSNTIEENTQSVQARARIIEVLL